MTEELFDLTEKYEAMLQHGLELSGETLHYFISGRLHDLQKTIPSPWTPKRILDLGCGIGHTSHRLSLLFPEAHVLGLDTSEFAIGHARKSYETGRLSFGHLRTLSEAGTFDLCYVNGVFHHIVPDQRAIVLSLIFDALLPGGYFAFFENNPWNFGTRMVMKRIPFDRKAIPLSSRESRALIRHTGFRVILTTRYLFYFPKFLSFLRWLEPGLVRFPLGSQYFILSRK